MMDILGTGSQQRNRWLKRCPALRAKDESRISGGATLRAEPVGHYVWGRIVHQAAS